MNFGREEYLGLTVDKNVQHIACTGVKLEWLIQLNDLNKNRDFFD